MNHRNSILYAAALVVVVVVVSSATCSAQLVFPQPVLQEARSGNFTFDEKKFIIAQVETYSTRLAIAADRTIVNMFIPGRLEELRLEAGSLHHRFPTAATAENPSTIRAAGHHHLHSQNSKPGQHESSTPETADTDSRRPSFDFSSAAFLGSNDVMQVLAINVSSDDETLNLKTDESYTLTVQNGFGILNATTIYGAMRGLETFSQLVTCRPLSNPPDCYILGVHIVDYPRFPYRGLLIDTARHFLSLPTFFKTLDAMSYAKLNVLQIHLIDDQSWPLESKVFPLLTNAAYSPTHIYSQDEIRRIVKYAKERGIRIIPEIDTPAHAHSLAQSYPWMLTNFSCPDMEGRYELGNVNPVRESTYDFFYKLFEEVGALFDDEVIWIGGDEVTWDSWNCSTEVRDFMRLHNMSDIQEVGHYYEQRLIATVRQTGHIAYAWSDIRSRLAPNFTNYQDVVLSCWAANFMDGWELWDVTQYGLHAVRSGCYYIVEGRSTFETMYNCDPQNFTGTDEMKNLVVGGHASRWGENTDASNLIESSWPQTSAMAEKLWSPLAFTNSTGLIGLQGRINWHRCTLVNRGIAAIPVEVGFCPVEYEQNVVLDASLSDSSESDHGNSESDSPKKNITRIRLIDEDDGSDSRRSD